MTAYYVMLQDHTYQVLLISYMPLLIIFFKIYNQKNYSFEKKIDNHRNYYLDHIKNQSYKNRLNKIVQNLNLEND